MYPNVTQLATIHRAIAEAERLDAERRPPPRRHRRRFGLAGLRWSKAARASP